MNFFLYSINSRLLMQHPLISKHLATVVKKNCLLVFFVYILGYYSNMANSIKENQVPL